MPTSETSATLRWWRAPPQLRRVVVDAVADEWRRLRPQTDGPTATSDDWADALEFGPKGLDADSLELLSLATAMVERFHLHRAGLEDYLLVHRRIGAWVELIGQSLARYDAEISFRSSGSADAPKSCVHRLSRLEEEAAALAALIGPRILVVATVPAHHIYGFLLTALAPGYLNAAVTDRRGGFPARILRDAPAGSVIVAAPDWWAHAARSDAPIPPDLVGVSSTAPLPPEVARRLRALGLARMLELYGSSETAGIGWRDDPDAPFRLFPWWRIDADDGRLVHRRDGDAQPPPDRLAVAADGAIALLGRWDAAVQIGGTNVRPQAVAAVLRAHPQIRDAAVRPWRVDGATRLKAFIVLEDAAAPDAPLRAEIDAWIAARLTPLERPRSLTFGAALPTGPMGKSADWAVDAAP